MVEDMLLVAVKLSHDVTLFEFRKADNAGKALALEYWRLLIFCRNVTVQTILAHHENLESIGFKVLLELYLIFLCSFSRNDGSVMLFDIHAEILTAIQAAHEVNKQG